MHVPPIFLRPFDLALLYAMVPPLVGAALLAIGTVATAPYLGSSPRETVFFLLFGSYLYGAPPLALTGIATALSARSGIGFAGLVLISAVSGFLFTGLVTAGAALLWWDVAGWPVILGPAGAGGAAGGGAALTLGLLAALRHRSKDIVA
jgi:hypothetical protein